MGAARDVLRRCFCCAHGQSVRRVRAGQGSVLTAYYDLHTSPPTYDIVAFLLAAENYRLERGEERIRIEILPGPAGGFRADRLWPFSVEERRLMLDRVALPMARMLPSADVVLRTDRPERRGCPPGSIGYMTRLYGLKVQVEMMRRGIRPLRPKMPLPRDPELVTITLREADHWPGRNSNLPEWRRAAELIEARGYHVVVIRDTRMANVPFHGFTTSPVASRQLERRATLYREAAVNLGANGGPLWFALALDARTMIFRPTAKGHPASSLDYLAACGIPMGGQIPGAPAYLRLVWADDTADEILAAFDDFTATAARQRHPALMEA